MVKVEALLEGAWHPVVLREVRPGQARIQFTHNGIDFNIWLARTRVRFVQIGLR